MNSDVQWESTDYRSQLRFKQKEGKVRQALLLISPAFVETLRETRFLSQDHSSGVSGPPLAILHQVRDHSIS